MTFGIVRFILKLFFVSMINQIIYLREYGLLLSEVITLRQTEATMPPKRYYLLIKLCSVKCHNAEMLTPLLGAEL
jgi:hypothetical protein